MTRHPTASCLSSCLIVASRSLSVGGFSNASIRTSRVVPSAFVREQIIRRTPRHSRRCMSKQNQDKSAGGDNADAPSKKKDEGQSSSQQFTPAEIAQKEQEASRRVMNRLLLPDKMGKAINFAAWFFVISSIALESLGYGYVPKEGGGLTIDTLDHKAFVMEMRRSSHETKDLN